MKKLLLKFIIFSVLLGMLFLSIVFQHVLSPQLKINEVSFQNNSGEDWVEIYNPGMSAKNLKGMYLTDNKEEKTKFKITEDILLNPQSFLVIGGKNTSSNNFLLKINFGLKNGETLYLIEQSGVEVIDAIALVAKDEDSVNTLGRFPDGSEELFTFSLSTQGEKNIKDKLSQE